MKRKVELSRGNHNCQLYQLSKMQCYATPWLGGTPSLGITSSIWLHVLRIHFPRRPLPVGGYCLTHLRAVDIPHEQAAVLRPADHLHAVGGAEAGDEAELGVLVALVRLHALAALVVPQPQLAVQRAAQQVAACAGGISSIG